jgi:hypothetical protein
MCHTEKPTKKTPPLCPCFPWWTTTPLPPHRFVQVHISARFVVTRRKLVLAPTPSGLGTNPTCSHNLICTTPLLWLASLIFFGLHMASQCKWSAGGGAGGESEGRKCVWDVGMCVWFVSSLIPCMCMLESREFGLCGGDGA